MNVDHQELTNYLKSEGYQVTIQDVLMIERLAISKKMECQVSERLIAYSVAAWKKFNIPPDQAIDLAAKSLVSTLRTFVDSLVSEGFKEWEPVIESAAKNLRAQLIQRFGEILMRKDLDDEERSVYQIPVELIERFESKRLQAQAKEIKKSQLTLNEAMEEIGSNFPQLPE